MFPWSRKDRWPRKSGARPREILTRQVPVELGDLSYINLNEKNQVIPELSTIEFIKEQAKEKNCLILANFVEWPG